MIRIKQVHNQMYEGKLANTIKETKERLASENVSEDDGRYLERVLNFLMDLGIDKYGPEFDRAVNKEEQ